MGNQLQKSKASSYDKCRTQPMGLLALIAR